MRVSKLKFRVPILEMFCTELKFLNDFLHKFFEVNIKFVSLETNIRGLKCHQLVGHFLTK